MAHAKGVWLKSIIETNRGVLVPGLILAAAFIVLVVAVKTVSGPLPGDLGLERGIQNWLAGRAVRDQWADGAFGVLSVVLPATAVLATLVWRRFKNAAVTAGSVLSAWIAAGILQILIARPRPSPAIVHVYAIDRSPGFPSVSVTGEVVLASVLILLLWRAKRIRRRLLRIALIATGACFALLGSLAEIYIGRHWPSDVFGGWLFAGAWFALLVVTYSSFTMPSGRIENPDDQIQRGSHGAF